MACVATNIDTGEEVVINQGSVSEAVRASISIPALFAVVKREGRYLVDGGLVNPVPTSVVKQMGADFIIAVNVIPDVTDRMRRAGNNGTGGYKAPDIIHILLQSLHISTYSLVRSSLEWADIVIEPDVAHIGARDFHRVQECVLQGEVAAQESVSELKRRLKIKGWG